MLGVVEHVYVIVLEPKRVDGDGEGAACGLDLRLRVPVGPHAAVGGRQLERHPLAWVHHTFSERVVLENAHRFASSFLLASHCGSSMISSPCSAARRRYFSLSSTCPGGGSSIRGAGWPIFL